MSDQDKAEVTYKYRIAILTPMNKFHNDFDECVGSMKEILKHNDDIHWYIGLNNCNLKDNLKIRKYLHSKLGKGYSIFNYGDISLGNTRNNLIRDSEGNFILFLDSDDSLCNFSHAFDWIMEKFDLITFNNYSVDEGVNFVYNTVHVDQELYDNPLQNFKESKLFQYMWGKLIKRELAEKIHFYDCTVFEDVGAFIDLITNAKNIARLDDIIYVRKKNGKSVSSTISEHTYNGLIECVNRLIETYPDGSMMNKIDNLISYVRSKGDADEELLEKIHTAYETKTPIEIKKEEEEEPGITEQMNRISCEKWTSELIITSDVEIDEEWVNNLFEEFENNIILDVDKPEEPEDSEGISSEPIIRTVEGTTHTLSNNAISTLAELTSASEEDLRNFATYEEGKEDYTGILKGAMIRYIADALENDKNATKYCVSFGGDILSKGINSSVRISDKLSVNLSNTFCCFTSNNLKRPDHIKVSETNNKIELYDSVTYVRKDNDAILSDMMATGLFANGNVQPFSDSEFVIYTKNGMPVTPHEEQSIYIASPWFDEHEEQVKRDMMSPFEYIFDPHETDASKSYAVTPGTELAKVIAADNINAITTCAYTVYPKLTDDLGTLFDLGCSIKEGNVTICYNEKDKTYIVVDSDATRDQIKDITEPTIVSVKTRSDAITLGYNLQNKDMICYETELHDNIMLSTSFKRVAKNNYGVYEFITVDQKEIR